VYVLTGQLLLAVVGLAAPSVCVRLQAQKWLRKRRNSLREQFPDALRGLGMCFIAGLSLEQAFDQTAQECREPLRRELRRAVDDLRTGSSILETLESLDARLAMDDMRFVAVAMEIQHRTGGSMREVLDATADSMLASFDLSRSLEVQTAQARMSARVVSILPLALVLVLSLAMEGYLATFFSSPEGLALLLIAVGMQLAGILIIRRILGVDLG
jgi:tight adherence protein B